MESSRIIEEIKIQLARTFEYGDGDGYLNSEIDYGNAARSSYMIDSSPSDLIKTHSKVQSELDISGKASNEGMSASVVALMNLNHQVDLSNSLLNQMQTLENQNIDSQKIILSQQNDIEVLSNQLKELKEKNETLDSKLYSAVFLSERLAAQNKSMQNEYYQKCAELAHCNGELESHQLGAKESASEILRLTSTIRELENVQFRYQQSTQEHILEGSNKVNRIQAKSDKLEKDLKESRMKNVTYEEEIVKLRDEILQLNRQKDRQNLLFLEEIASKEIKIEENRKLSQDLSTINKKYLDLNMKHSEALERIDDLTLRNNDLVKSTQLTLKSSEIYESKIKEMEEIMNYNSQELNRANLRNVELENIVDLTEKRLEQIEKRSKTNEGDDEERRNMIYKSLNDRLEEVTKLLSASNALLVEEKAKSEDHISKLMGDYHELNLQIKQMREDHEAKIIGFLNEKKELHNRCVSFEVAVTDLERDRKREREAMYSEKLAHEKACMDLKIQFADKCAESASFLNIVSKQIVALKSKSVELCNENTNILIHHNKVCNILHSLIGYNFGDIDSNNNSGVHNGNSELREALKSGSLFANSNAGTPSATSNFVLRFDESSNVSQTSIPPVLRPSVLYGGECRQLVGYLISLNNKLQIENESLQKTVSALELEKNEFKFQSEGLSSDCESLKNQTFQLQKLCSSLESQLNNSKESYKLLQATSNESISNHSNKENKLQSEIDDLVSQCNALQGEIYKNQGENLQLKNQNVNISENLRNQKREFDKALEDCNDELKKKDIQIQTISDEFSKLQTKYKANMREFMTIKEKTSKLTEVIKQENSNFHNQISLLNETIEKMEVQLHQKQILIDSLQAQRSEINQMNFAFNASNSSNSSNSGNSGMYTSGHDFKSGGDSDALARLAALNDSFAGMGSTANVHIANNSFFSSSHNDGTPRTTKRSGHGDISGNSFHYSNLNSHHLNEILSVDIQNAQIRQISNNLLKKT